MVKRKSRLWLNHPRSTAAKINSKNKHIVENIPVCTSDSPHKNNTLILRRKIKGTPSKSPPCKVFKQRSTPSKSPFIKRLKKNTIFYVPPSVSKCPSVSFKIIKNDFDQESPGSSDKVLKCQNNQIESESIGVKCTGPSKSRRALLERFENNTCVTFLYPDINLTNFLPNKCHPNFQKDLVSFIYRMVVVFSLAYHSTTSNHSLNAMLLIGNKPFCTNSKKRTNLLSRPCSLSCCKTFKIIA
jgi:hypothetical protein